MVDKVSGFLQSRRKTKLYQQWVKLGGLPPEDVPQDVITSKRERPSGWSADELGSSMNDVAEEDVYRTLRRRDADSGLVPLPVRYILLGGGLITLLLVILAVVSTILIMRSC